MAIPVAIITIDIKNAPTSEPTIICVVKLLYD